MIYDPNKYIYIIHKNLPWVTTKTESFYGWTQDKKMLKNFLKIRNKDYYYDKLFEYEMDEDVGYVKCKNTLLKKEFKLDIITLISKTGKELSFISTEDEIVQAENKILLTLYNATEVAIFEEDELVETVRAFQMLNKEYIESLDYIGYVPKELRQLAAEESCSYPVEVNPDGWDMVQNTMLGVEPIAKGTVYSFEAFIMVLRGEFRFEKD